MAAYKNIGSQNKDDAFYRYKRPKMITKIEGRGNGIKTNVVNMVDIAKALARPASYTTKYFGCELGAQSKFDEKTGASYVNGAHATAKLDELLENFIKKFVQCHHCGNPETEVIISKRTEMITLKCAACGNSSDVDMMDKLTPFILKHPPEQKKAKNKKALRKAEKERLKEGEIADAEMKKLKKEAVKKKGVTTSSKGGLSSKKKTSGSDEDGSSTGSHVDDNETPVANDDEEDDDVQWFTDTSLEAARQRVKEQLSAVTADMVMLSTTEEKKSDVKVAQNGIKSSNPRDSLVDEIEKILKKGSPSQLKVFLGSRTESSQEIMDALFEALFEGVEKGFDKEVVKKKNYLAAAFKENGDSGSGSHAVLLGAIELFCVKSSPQAMKEVALVLKALYDNDVLEEEYIIKWYQDGLSGKNKTSKIWKNAQPFIEWLQNAESESEE